MSWVSTGHYYHLINADVAERCGGDHCARLVIWQDDFDEMVRWQRAGRWDAAGARLAGGARALVAAGAELIVVRDARIARGISRVGLVGTSYTMESPDLYPPVMAAAGIEVVVPAEVMRARIQRHTFEELIKERVTEEGRATFAEAARELADRGAEAVVLACTEHGMVLRDGDGLSLVPVLDSTVLHARALVDASLAG